MKDPTIPPVLKLSGAPLGSAMGATLATKRTSAERLAEGCRQCACGVLSGVIIRNIDTIADRGTFVY